MTPNLRNIERLNNLEHHLGIPRSRLYISRPLLQLDVLARSAGCFAPLPVKHTLPGVGYWGNLDAVAYPFLTQLARKILATLGPPFSQALYYVLQASVLVHASGEARKSLQWTLITSK